MKNSFSRISLIKEFFAPEKTMLQFSPDLKGILKGNDIDELDELVDMIVEEWEMKKVSIKNSFGEEEVLYLGNPK